jgi:hypothetical protein
MEFLFRLAVMRLSESPPAPLSSLRFIDAYTAPVELVITAQKESKEQKMPVPIFLAVISVR